MIQGHPENVVKEVNLASGDSVKLCCSPLRAYENFAQKVLGVDEEIAKHVDPMQFEGELHWMNISVGYLGKYVKFSRNFGYF